MVWYGMIGSKRTIGINQCNNYRQPHLYPRPHVSVVCLACEGGFDRISSSGGNVNGSVVV